MAIHILIKQIEFHLGSTTRPAWELGVTLWNPIRKRMARKSQHLSLSRRNSDSSNLFRRVNGVIVKINSFRSGIGLSRINYEEYKIIVAQVLLCDKWICPVCLRIVSHLVHAHSKDEGQTCFFSFSTHPICHRCFKKFTADLRIPDVRFINGDVS